MLSEQNRQRLDGIVQKMVANNEPDSNIQFVVNDFKQKYDQPAQAGQSGVFQRNAFQRAAIGAGKGVISTLTGISSLGEKMLRGTTKALLPKPAEQALRIEGQKPTAAEQVVPQELRTPQDTAEKVGFFTEQLAEFLVPGGAVTKGAKAVGQLAPKGTQLLTRAAVEGAGTAGIVAAQTGGDKEQTKTAAILGAALPLITQPITKILSRAPKSLWSTVLKRTPTETLKNPKLPQQAAELGMAGTQKQIASQASKAIQQIELELDDLLKVKEGKIAPLKIAPYLDDLREAYSAIPGEQGALDAIENVARDFLSKKSLTVAEANQMKRGIYDLIAKSYSRGFLDSPAKVEAQKAIARGLKEEIEKIIPEAKSLNQRQAVYLQVRKAIEKQLARNPKGVAGTGIGLYDLLTGGLGILVGAPGGAGKAGVGALSLVAAKKISESTLIRTSVSKMIQAFNAMSPTKKLLFYSALRGLLTNPNKED